jgi:NIPSNAP
MKRREFVTTAASAGLAGAAAAETPRNSLYHLVYFYMRTGPQVTRTTGYLQQVFLPAAKRAGLGPAGFFSPVIGERSPYILSLVTYPGFAAIDTIRNKLAEDKEFQKGWDEYNKMGDPAYVRMESTLLRAFDGMPTLDVPPGDAQRAARIFELRMYESMNEKASERKIKMFEDGEAAIFRRLGMLPVFFGRSIVGPKQPSLTYMLAFDDLAARDRLWRNFGADPEWQKLRTQPGLSDAEIVSNISNEILRPLSFSQIR